ncbi:hypothetical protein ACVWZV_008735 [Bradyrhizobium sp. GM5.1]
MVWMNDPATDVPRGGDHVDLAEARPRAVQLNVRFGTSRRMTLIMTARLNNIDAKAWLADAFARIADMPQSCLHQLLPWN